MLSVEDLLKYKINNLIFIFYDYNLNKRKDAFLINIIEDNPEQKENFYRNLYSKFQKNNQIEEGKILSISIYSYIRIKKVFFYKIFIKNLFRR